MEDGMETMNLAATVVLGVYIAALAGVVFRFAGRNLDGDPGRRRFLGWLAFTALAVEGLVFPGNFGLFLGFWMATSLGVHHLLEHFRDRRAARVVAWEKFLVSRIGDLALVGAGAVLWVARGTWNFADLAAQPWTGWTAHLAALLVVVGALTKSAQVPFHSWLPRTLEAPTAVSAFLHAGIINAGGLLLVRFGFLVQGDGAALAVLVAVGGLTAVWGGFTMLVQADVKRRLAWSTVGQMGFMMVEIGLGAPALALVHLMGHGLYKARSFLWSGDPKAGKAPVPGNRTRGWPVAAGAALWAATGAAGVAATAAVAPGHLVLGTVVWAALVPLAVGGWSRPGSGGRSWALATLVLAASAGVSWAAGAVLGLPEALTWGRLRDGVGLAVAFGLAVSGAVSVLSPWLSQARWYRAVYASALHGFGWGRWPESLASQGVR
jgi:NAD(P)H-quinone oxidoreductase subunit 5